MTACIVGWAHLPFGRREEEDVESLSVEDCFVIIDVLAHEVVSIWNTVELTCWRKTVVPCAVVGRRILILGGAPLC